MFDGEIPLIKRAIIKLMMQKHHTSASLCLKQHTVRSFISEERRLKRKIPYKIEICNQNLEEAIKQVRASIRDNPEWRLNVKAVVSQYPASKDKRVNDSQRLDKLQQHLPISEKLVFPSTTETPQNIFEKLKFTERKKQEFEIRTKELKERRMQLEVSLLEKQMKAKLERKIQENLKLKEKRELMKDIEQHREESIRFHETLLNRRKMESSLLHESNVASAKMIRKCRSKSQRQLINEHKARADESAESSHFKEIQMSKSKLEKQEIILTRYKNLRSASQGSLQRRSKINLHPE